MDTLHRTYCYEFVTGMKITVFRFWGGRICLPVMGMMIMFLQAHVQVHAGEFFSSEGLKKIAIEVDADDWRELCDQTRSFAQALSEDRRDGEFSKPFTWFPASATVDGVKYENIGLRKKGFIGSLDSERPSLKIKLNYEGADYRIEGMDQLTLNNCKQDPPIVNQHMAYRLFNEAGIPAPRTAFAHVTVNGESLGVYCIVETMRKTMIERHFGNHDGVLYEGTVTDFYDGWANSLEQKFGNEELGLSRIKALIDVLENEDSATIESIGEIVDIPSFLKYWSIEAMIGFWDGYSGNSNNYFFYIPEMSGKMHFMPWGADSVFTTRDMFRRNIRYQSVKTGGRLAGRLYKDADIRKQYGKTMTEILQNHWKADEMIAEIDRLEKLIGPHVHEAQSQYANAMDEMRDFIRSRSQNLLDEIADGMPDDVEITEREPMFFAIVGTLEVQFETTWQGDDSNSGDAETETKVSGTFRHEDEEIGLDGVVVTAGQAPRNRFGFGGGPGRGRGGRGQDGPPPVQISITVPGESGVDPYVWNLTIDGNQFKKSTSEVNAGGMMTKGRSAGFFGRNNAMVEASILLEEASTADGEDVKGTIKARAMRMSRSPF